MSTCPKEDKSFPTRIRQFLVDSAHFFALRVRWEEPGLWDQKIRRHGQDLEHFPSQGKLNSLISLSVLSSAKGEW